MTLFFELIAVGVLILLNAFFVAAEYGLVTARRTRIIELHHEGNRRARDVLRITGNPPRTYGNSDSSRGLGGGVRPAFLAAS